MNSRGTVGTLSAGKYFGDLYSETAKATVVTTEDSELVMVPLELIDAIRCLLPSLGVLCVSHYWLLLCRDGGEADAGNDEQLARLRFVHFQIGEGTFAEVTALPIVLPCTHCTGYAQVCSLYWVCSDMLTVLTMQLLWLCLTCSMRSALTALIVCTGPIVAVPIVITMAGVFSIHYLQVFPCEMEGQPEMVAVKCIHKSTVVAKKMQHQVSEILSVVSILELAPH